MRWYSEWLQARLSRSANRAMVGLSLAINVFIHDLSKFVGQDNILPIERNLVCEAGRLKWQALSRGMGRPVAAGAPFVVGMLL